MLLSDKRVADCAVIGLPDPRDKTNELPRAYVVRQQGSKLREEDVKKLISENLASYKKLTGGVRFMDEIPKSPSGKILKRLLREMVQKEGEQVRAKL